MKEAFSSQQSTFSIQPIRGCKEAWAKWIVGVKANQYGISH
jgi:hypothetical protein